MPEINDAPPTTATEELSRRHLDALDRAEADAKSRAAAGQTASGRARMSREAEAARCAEEARIRDEQAARYAAQLQEQGAAYNRARRIASLKAGIAANAERITATQRTQLSAFRDKGLRMQAELASLEGA